MNEGSPLVRLQKQITVTSSERAGANHLCKTWKYQESRQEATGG